MPKIGFQQDKGTNRGPFKVPDIGRRRFAEKYWRIFGDLGIKVLEGFGLTETSPVMAVTENERIIYGTVGRIIPRIEVAIQNVDTKEIYTIQTHDTFKEDYQSDEGEIIVRGHCVMKGYWNNPRKRQP